MVEVSELFQRRRHDSGGDKKDYHKIPFGRRELSAVPGFVDIFSVLISHDTIQCYKSAKAGHAPSILSIKT